MPDNDLFTDPAFNSKGIDLGQLYHVGIVTYDLDEAVQRYSQAFGIDNWRSRTNQPAAPTPQPVAHGEPARVPVQKWAYTNYEKFPWIEFLQPDISVDSVLTRFLKERGEGVHHLGFFVDDLRLAVQQAEERGVTADFTSFRGGENGEPVRGIAYLSPKQAKGISMELVSPDLRDILVNFVKTGEWPETL